MDVVQTLHNKYDRQTVEIHIYNEKLTEMRYTLMINNQTDRCRWIGRDSHTDRQAGRYYFLNFIQSLGQAGRVVKVFPTGDVRVAVNGRVWTFNPLCMVPAPGENPPEVSRESCDI